MRRTGHLLAAVALLSVVGAAPPGPPRVRLVETRPVETRIGNPGLPEAAQLWVRCVAQARQELDLEEFYFSDWPNEALRPVIDEIGRAARRGVQVRLLLDARMHKTYPLPADSLGKLPNIEVRTIDFGKLAGGVQHAKYFLVDGRTAYLGSQNLDWRSLKHIHELGVCILDSLVTRVYQDVFEMDWKLAADPAAAPQILAAGARSYAAPYTVINAPGDTVWLWPGYTPSGWIPDSTLWDEALILRTLDSARREVVLQSLTYSPTDRGRFDDAFDIALRRAAARGVKVELVISDWNTGHPGIDYLKSLALIPNIGVKISTVPEWSGGYIPFARVEHCKYMVVDSLWTWVGTSNWEPGYFYTTRNVGVTMKNRALAAQARTVFENTWKSPIAHPVDPGKEYSPVEHGDRPPAGKKKYGG